MDLGRITTVDTNTVVVWRTLLFRDTELLLPAIFVPRLRTISYRTVEL